MSHAPSEARAIRRAIRSGDGDIEGLLGQARRLRDPAHAAPVLALLAADPRLDAETRIDAARLAAARARETERVGQKAEVWSEVLKALGAEAVEAATEAALTDVEAMPDGEWTHATIAALAPQVGAMGRRRLFTRALVNPGFEAEGCKAVLDAADLDGEPGLVDAARSIDDPDVRRRVLGHLHHAGQAGQQDAVEAAWNVPERDARIEALRALAYQCRDADALDAMARSVRGRDPEEAARLYCALAARADRLGHLGRMERYLDHALELATDLETKPRRKIANKVETALRKAGLDTEAARAIAVTADHGSPEASGERTSGPEERTARRSGHRLAVVDAYEGGLGLAHLRAASRAASLCLAFGHDLVLVGFPTDDLQTFIDAAASETSIGEDARPLQALRDAGRVRLVGSPTDLDGAVVATTPHPAAGKEIRLERLRGPVTLAVGLGKKGLPPAMLEAASGHYELTGRGVSLETATAMGILADRLAHVPAQ